eukprot:g1055.t1
MKFEDLDEMLKTCTAAVICPEPSEATEPALEQAKLALRSILSGAEELKEVILLSHVGAQDDKGGFNLGAFFTPSGTSWASIEDELTSTARARSTNRPLRYVIVRVADPPETVSSAGEVRCFPAAEGAPVSGSTSLDTAAEAIFQARIAAIECIKTAFQPDDDLAGAFAEALGAAHFTEHGTEEAVEALEYLGPQNPAALRCIIAGLNAKSQMLDEFLMLRRRRMKKKRAPVEEEEVDTDKNDAEKEMRQRCLEIFKQIEAKLSAAEVIDTLLKEILLATHNPVGGTPSSGVQQEALLCIYWLDSWYMLALTWKRLTRNLA